MYTKTEVKKEIKEKEEMRRNIDMQLEQCPEGSLTCQTKGEKVYYYHQIKGITAYIKRKEKKLAEQLAQKQYLEDIRNKLDEQIQVLTHFNTVYDETALEQIYENLPEERKQLVTPIVHGVKEKLEAWNKETYKPYEAYSEYKIYETERGEMVRSKSEVIIANLLYKNRKDLDYKYERPLILKEKNGKEITIHPDFTIINRHTGNIYYYEHVGKLDEARYAIDFTKKMELYTMNNIMQGKELLLTYETAGVPLSIRCVRKIIEMCI